MQLFHGLGGLFHDASQLSRPILTHLNADTSWLLSLPYPGAEPHPRGRKFFHILIDPWLQGPQTDLASWFSQQWHATASSVQTISELNTRLKELETLASAPSATDAGEPNTSSHAEYESDALGCIDIVVVSHEFTDHCNRATLEEVSPDTPIFATEAAAHLISSWQHFRHVYPVASFSKRSHDWRNTSPDALPSWLGISRIITKRDALHLHSAILLTFNIRSSAQDEAPEGIIYSPHGILANDLEILSLASPRINVLALLHGLHHIKLGVRQLNLGARNALRAQRTCGAKYWVSTHDEVKKAGGIVSRFLKRKVWTVDEVLQDESRKAQKNGAKPPPSYGNPKDEQSSYAAPSGPPPGNADHPQRSHSPPNHLQTNIEPPPYHDWTVIEDTALLPPPPSLGHKTSPSGNASLSDADRAHGWCRRYPLIQPRQPTPVQSDSVKNGQIQFVKPKEYQGTLSMIGTGRWLGSTVPGGKEACVLSSLPCYFAVPDSPLVAEHKKIIYFEVKVKLYGQGRGGDASSLAVGYCAVPYPTWRMPGWERGSLAVHGDDGRRYVNDSWGGKDFTSAIKEGETVGLGMEFSIPDAPPSYGSTPAQTPTVKVEVFFTRNGIREASWNLHEELDAENDLGVEGLDGQHDLYAAIGVFGGVDYEVNFDSQSHLWLDQPA
ncbi:MAG: hypothetical protein Q9177_002871 [Variospora cf. flavescens]